MEKITASLLALLGIFPVAATAADSARPNILFILADDHGRHMGTLEEPQAADPKFTPARDWHPQPGTPEATEAEKPRAAAKDQSPSDDAPKKKRKKVQP